MKYSKTDLSLFSPTVAKYRMCVSFHIFVGGESAKDDAHHCMRQYRYRDIYSEIQLNTFLLITGLPLVHWAENISGVTKYFHFPKIIPIIKANIK